MDSSFTEQLLERARVRQQKLQQLSTTEITSSNKHHILNENKRFSQIITKEDDQNGEYKIKDIRSEGRVQEIIQHNPSTKISSDLPASPKNKLQTLNIQKENLNMEIKLISSDKVRVEVEIQESDALDNEDISGKSNVVLSGLRLDAQHKLKKLGKLYAGGEDADISSPIHRTEEHFLNEHLCSTDYSKNKSCINLNSKRGLSKLADLAENIKHREENIYHVKTYNENKNRSPMKFKSIDFQVPESTQKIPQVSVSNNSLKSHEKKVSSLSRSPLETKIESIEENGNVAAKMELDQQVLRTLECQGFTRTTSNSCLIYDYSSNTERELNKQAVNLKLNLINEAVDTTTKQLDVNEKYQQPIIVNKLLPLEIKKIENKLTPCSPKKNVQSLIASKTAIFESSPQKQNNDPALMSLADRKALFERNKGAALIPKAAFAMSVPFSNKENKTGNVTITKTQRNVNSDLKSNSHKEINEECSSTEVNIAKNNKSKYESFESCGIASKIVALINNKNTISEEQISKNIKEQKQKDMEVVLNRFNKKKQIVENISNSVNNTEQDCHKHLGEITTFCTPDKEVGEKKSKKADSPQVAAVLEDVKRVKVGQPKDGRLYPSLSDIETANDTETELEQPRCDNSDKDSSYSSQDDANTSFGRDIMEALYKAQPPQKRPILEENTSDVSDILDDMDDYLDEAMANENFDYNNGPTPPKIGKIFSQDNEKKISKPSNSFHYKSFSPSAQQCMSAHETSSEQMSSPRQSSGLPTYVVEGDSVLPLTHTVSFYRKQLTPIKTSVRQIIRQHNDVPEYDNSNSQNKIIAVKIQELLEEINKQQLIIAQTSQALNLCNSTLEFMGSTEQVEAEKLLLLATHRRQTCLHEVQRLKVEGTLRPQGQHAQNIPLEKGSLVITNIILPMKKEYVRALAAAGGKGHHVVCLIKCGEQVVATQLTSTVVSSKNPDHDLHVPGNVTLKNIYSDFTVTFEVYCLQAQEEILPHEVKYHINKKTSSKLTPKKTKQESRMVFPPKESPAGPQAVRSSTFALMGYIIFSVQSINKTHWTLNKIPSMSPLEGRVEMQVSCDLNVSIEHKGFLTAFEDISGFGAWHRRWYMLKGYTLSYWKYPDDEKKKPPTEAINLRNSITKAIGPVNRDICARQHTFLIETERNYFPDDKESLTLICKTDKTIIRHLLSADTKEERIEWCEVLNKALTALKIWGKKI